MFGAAVAKIVLLTLRVPECVSCLVAVRANVSLQITTGQFRDLDLSRNTHAAISDVLGYTNMTKVQEQSIPICLTGTR